jgi:glycosyltransferase involved in cell wall biosynthesis
MNNLSISVIIPAYQAAKIIGRAVDSALRQTCSPKEILVIDDGSRDDLAGALAPYGDRVTLIRKANGGAASARNLGIDRARGDLIAFLDADDYWEPEKLEKQLAIFQRHPEVGLTAGRFFAQYPGQQRYDATPPICFEPDTALTPSGNMIFEIGFRLWTTTVLIRRRALGENRFDESLQTAEDRDLWIGLLAANPVYFSSEYLATGIFQASSLSRSNVDRDCTNMLRVLHKHAALLSRSELRHWEANVYRRWAAARISQGQARAALDPAWSRLCRQYLSPQSWWIVLKCLVRGYGPLSWGQA